ncbi:MAG: 30S ribosomal protein S1 [Deltaproteobacteria bacterium]|nr:30S ribosomal protein S1 [Deltaproteobacteria bacterium]
MQNQTMPADEAEFIALFEQWSEKQDFNEGDIVEGKVLSIGKDFVIVDIGYKSEGQIPVAEFVEPDGSIGIAAGDQVEVYVEARENDMGLVELSKEKADRLKIWDEIAEACENEELVEGVITGRVKGGLTVDIGVKAFLPGSQVDLRPVRNLEKYIGQRFHFKVIKFNKKRGNIVLSRRALLEKQREALKNQTLAQLEEGMLIDGVVKNITDYGAFIDLGGIDGLLHITDMSWARINHPSEMFEVGQNVRVKVLKYDPERERVSLGLKQNTEDPWLSVDTRYGIGQSVAGKVVSLTDYGAFIEIEEGVEGLVHVSEMSWTKRVKHPSQLVNVGDDVEAVILEIDARAKRISLGMKQAQQNPWDVLAEKYPPGTQVKGTVRNITNFGIFIGIDEGIDGLCHVTDLSWGHANINPADLYKKGDEVEAVVLSIDPEKERFSLGIKQLQGDPWMTIHGKYPRGSVQKGKVAKILDFGAIVELDSFIEGFLHISEIAEEKVENIHKVLEEGQDIEVKILSIIPEERKLGLSLKRVGQDDDDYVYDNAAPEAATTLGELIRAKLDLSNLPDANDGQ